MTSTETFNPPASTPISPMFKGARVWAAGLMLFAGLGLMALGGCFLIGVLLTINPSLVPWQGQPATMSDHALIFLVVLYALGFACFVGAVVMIVLGSKGLWAVVKDRTFQS